MFPSTVTCPSLRCPYKYYPLNCIPFLLPKLSPFWRQQVGIESVSEMANIFPVFYTKFFSVSDTLFFFVSDTLFIPISDILFIPVSYTLFIPVSVTLFNKVFIPVSDTLFIPVSDTLLIPVSGPALSRAISAPAPVAAMCTRQRQYIMLILSQLTVSVAQAH